MKKPNPYEGAPCTTEEEHAWAARNRGHRWDTTVAGEAPARERARRARSVRLCRTCPALEVCDDERQAILAGQRRNPLTGERLHLVGVIWAGRIYPDKEPGPDQQDSLIGRGDLVA